MDTTFSAREAAALFGRSYSWLDQRLRAGDFKRRDGTTIEPLRTPGNYRRFDVPILKDIAFCCYRNGWLRGYDKLRMVLFNVATAAVQSQPEF
ncbi:hypothetical protein [Mycolicibacterium sp. CBMA 226]|uniref:DUF7229 domain-containing protein n=1 Tax=Mycolicibacterium sp. CBMA 226 TaxID=2606611 RepID=UPI0012DD1592|nr:hypothetical protein [Mycolicibacterium sp. CBMA 226]MUL76441.1 hypothetical protein [Mycolicibacterium sp. CBMA 226]